MLESKSEQAICRKCKHEYLAKEHEFKKSDFMCRPCRREFDKEYRLKRKAAGNPVISGKMPRSYHQEYDKVRLLDPAVRLCRAEQMRGYAKNPALRIRHESRWKVSRAIASGRLVKQPCEICGEIKADAHHDDYSKPLEVRWLCRTHHAEHHAKAKGKS